MKKSLLIMGLLFVATQTHCGMFDTAMSFLQKNGMDLLKKGAQYVSDNSDTIFNAVKENSGPLFDKAKELLFGKTKEEADKQEKELVTKAKDIIAKNPGLTLAEQQALLKEAGDLAQKNRIELEKVAKESIEKKRATLKQSMYDRFGKGTPTI